MRYAKNNVSYFEAGYRAGLIDGGIKKSEVDNRFYSGLVYPNRVRDLLSEYNRYEDDKDAVEAMESLAMKKRKLRYRIERYPNPDEEIYESS